jgi:hypothetical protein
MTADQDGEQGIPKRRYFSTIRATEWSPPDLKQKLVYALLWFIPRANPDYDFTAVRKWYVEVDENGQPIREIALNEHGAPLFGAPWRNNFGFWIDSEGPLPSEGTQEIDEASFMAAWSTLVASASDRCE